MTTTAQQVDALLSVRSEDEHLEFKVAENRYDFEELVGYCVALANEDGGRMVLGVTDNMCHFGLEFLFKRNSGWAAGCGLSSLFLMDFFFKRKPS